MKKVKKMMFGGISKGVASAAQKAAAEPKMKALGLGEGIARAAGKPVGTTVNAPATIQPIGGMRPSGKGTTGGPLVKPPPPGMVGLGQAMSNLGIKKGAGNVGSMIGQRFGGLGMKKGGKVSSASKRADGIAAKGKTKGKLV